MLARDTSSWRPQAPTPRQKLFLEAKHKEAFYGGAAGGGKSSALLMAALEYVDVPGYSALLLRRTFADLNKPEALMDRAREWLTPTAARWIDRDKCWLFPSGAKLSFGYMDTENDKFQYQGAAYQFVGFDELTQFTEGQYRYLFSRLRRLAGSDVPIRMRAASNPGGVGGNWVKERFIPEDFTPSMATEPHVFEIASENLDGAPTVRAFVPARIDDNPHLDRAEYRESLNEMDAVTREQLLAGDWSISERGNIYPMWDERDHVITWSEFERVFGSRYIPDHWTIGVGHDWGFDPHPYAVSFTATAAANSPLPGRVFLWAELCGWQSTAREVADRIKEVLAPRRALDRAHVLRMSHEASSEQLEYFKQGLTFHKWKPDRNAGIAQVRSYLEIRNRTTQNPFRPAREGEPWFYAVVPDEGLVNPKGEAHLARHRGEFPGYKYKTPKSGEPGGAVVPLDKFDDAMCALKGCAAYYFTPIVERTAHEKATNALVAAGETLDPDVLAQMSQPAQAATLVYVTQRYQEELKRAEEADAPILHWRLKPHED